ncbi:MAG: hypothetical protein R3E14_13835 [Erythrobacter sp.]
MRVALLSTLDHSPALGRIRPAYRNFAGSRVIERQVDLALAVGCETIACLVDGIGREVIEAQKRAEAAGARFVAMQEPRPLSGLVSAADEIFVIGAGVLATDEVALKYASRPCVLVFPADDALALGYERVDAEFAWAGVSLAHGSVVERLAELPSDSDVISALLRISLQSGVRIQPIEKRLLDEGRWHLDPSPEQLVEREQQWIHDHAAPASFVAPGLAVSERIGARLARDVLGGRWARMPAVAAGISGLVALAFALTGWEMTALGFGALMATLGTAGETVERIALAGQSVVKRSPLARTIDWMTDPVLALLMGMASPEDTEWLRLFVPGVLLGLLRLGQRWATPKWRDSYRDRVALSLLLLPAAFFGVVQPVVAVLVLIVMLTLFFAPSSGE